MPRSVNHIASKARRKKILKLTRDYFDARKNAWTVVKNAWEKDLTYTFRDCRNKKRNFHAPWTQHINVVICLEEMSHSKLVGGLHKVGVGISRKVLADLIVSYPEVSKTAIVKTKAA